MGTVTANTAEKMKPPETVTVKKLAMSARWNRRNRIPVLMKTGARVTTSIVRRRPSRKEKTRKEAEKNKRETYPEKTQAHPV